MQETYNETEIGSPDSYDWSEFTRKERGFLAHWCRDHKYTNGEEFNYKTVFALIAGDYTSGAGPKIKEIIRAALKDRLIFPIPEDLDQAA
jgi:hypothetical protein